MNASEPVEALLQRVSLIPDLGGASYPDESDVRRGASGATRRGASGATPTRAPGADGRG